MQLMTALTALALLAACSVARAAGEVVPGQGEDSPVVEEPATSTAQMSPTLTAPAAAMELKRLQAVQEDPAYYVDFPHGSGVQPVCP